MDRLKTVRPLVLAGPVALGTVLAAAPQASAAIGGAVLSNPHVVDNGKTLNVVFSTAITDAVTDNIIVRNVVGDFVGSWVGDLVGHALPNTPTRASTCRATITAIDSNGANGSASAAVPAGVTNIPFNVPDQKPGTSWGVGDRDHFTATLVCTDSQSGGQLSEVTIDRDETAI